MRIRSLVAALAAGLAVTSLFAPIPAQAQQKFITVGTGGIVGVYYPLGGAICRFVNAAPQGPQPALHGGVHRRLGVQHQRA